MRSLDDLLTEKAQDYFRERFSEALDPSTWTKENRDEKLVSTRAICSELSEKTEEFVKEILDTTIENKSLLHWKVLEQFITGEVETLMGYRDELDRVPVEMLDTLAVDYLWLSDRIRERLIELSELNNKIEHILDTGETQEL